MDKETFKKDNDSDTSSIDTIIAPPEYSEYAPPRPPSPAPTYHTLDINGPDEKHTRTPSVQSTTEPSAREPSDSRLSKAWSSLKATGYFSVSAGSAGFTALHHAARSGKVSAIPRLTKQLGGLDIDIQTPAGWTPLYVAIWSASETTGAPTVQAFLDAGADPTLPGPEGWNALHIASYWDRVDIINVLMQGKTGLDVHGLAPDGRTAIERAAERGLERVVELLLTYGAASVHPVGVLWDRTTALHLAAHAGHAGVVSILISWEGTDCNVRDPQGYTAADRALLGDKGEALQRLLAVGAEVTVSDMEGGGTLLHRACRSGWPDVVKALLDMEEYQSVINQRTRNGFPPSFVAALFDQRKALSSLIAQGADLGLLVDGLNVLEYAVKYGKRDAVRALVGSGQVNSELLDSRSFDGDTVLHQAAIAGDKDVLIMLLEVAMSLREATNAAGRTALHLACERNNHRAAWALMRAKANVYAQDTEGLTPLMLAAQSGHCRVIKTLVSKKQNDLQKHLPIAGKLPPVYEDTLVPFLCGFKDLRNDPLLGRPTLRYAVRVGHMEVFKYLCDEIGKEENHSESLKSTNIRRAINRIPDGDRDEDGRTLLEVACANSHWEMARMVDDYLCRGMRDLVTKAVEEGRRDIMESIIKNGSELIKGDVEQDMLYTAARPDRVDDLRFMIGLGANIKGKEGASTALWLAALLCNTGAVQILLAHGADPNVRVSDGVSPLMDAAEVGHAAAIPLLLDHGANLEFRDKDERTALHRSIKGKNLDVTVALLEAGADVHAVDKHGQTPLAVAESCEHPWAQAEMADAIRDVMARQSPGKSSF